MSRWFLTFLIYSFLGYCLEKLFARAVHSPRQVRKCFLFLPLCPVYGLGMVAVLVAAPTLHSVLSLIITGGLVCTGAEYLVHWFYERLFGVTFWDYSALRWNFHGRICLSFSLVWGILSTLAVYFVQPLVSFVVGSVSRGATFLLWVIFVADCVFTASLLLHYHDTELLSWTTLVNQSKTSR